MMGPRQEAQPALFYEFSLEDHVPPDHLLRSIDRFVDLSGIRAYLADFYSHTGRPSVDPELLIRMLLVGYCFGIRSERRLCEEVHLNLAYRWFCRLDLSDRGCCANRAIGRGPPIPGGFRLTLLRYSADNALCAYSHRLHATASISARPKAEHRFMMAMRIWISAVWRSGSRDMIRSPRSLRRFIWASTRLREW